MGVRLEGRKKFHSNSKNKDFFQLFVSFDGDPGCGRWFDNPFVDESVFDSVDQSHYGKEIELKYGYVGGSRRPDIVGYEVKK